MKKLLYISIISLLLLPITACEDELLNLEDRDTLPTDFLLSNVSGMEAFLLEGIERMRSIHENTEISLYKQAGTDLVKGGTNLVDVNDGGMEGMHLYSAGLSAVSGEIESIWNAYYAALDRCNRVVNATEVLEPSNDSEAATFERLKGEALVLRAYAYLNLVRRFDNIPLSTLIPDGQEPSLDAPLQAKTIIYDQILADAEAAIPLLPTRATTGGVGSPSKGLAYHVLSLAHMDLGNWAEAATAAEGVIGDASYQLQDVDYIFGLEGGKQGEENNNEIIFSLTFDPAVDNRRQRTSQMYAPLYDRVNGVARSFSQGGRPWARYSLTDYYLELFDEEDLRLEAWHKTTWFYDDEENLPEGKSLGDPVTQEDMIEQFGEGAIGIRYIEPTTTKFWEDGTYGRLIGDAEGFRNIIVYRLSQAYLIGAEAHWRNGNEGRALELINAIRDRAFGDTEHRFTSLDENIIIDEHARELGHEGHRWAFLKRLGKLQERVQLFSPDAGPNIQSYHVRWPIPQSFVDLARVSQNENYN